MLHGNQLELAFVEKGHPKAKKRKKNNNKQFPCKKCGEGRMHIIPETNIMACDKDGCGNYFIFDKNVI